MDPNQAGDLCKCLKSSVKGKSCVLFVRFVSGGIASKGLHNLLVCFRFRSSCETCYWGTAIKGLSTNDQESNSRSSPVSKPTHGSSDPFSTDRSVSAKILISRFSPSVFQRPAAGKRWFLYLQVLTPRCSAA